MRTFSSVLASWQPRFAPITDRADDRRLRPTPPTWQRRRLSNDERQTALRAAKARVRATLSRIH